jgi:hypothetical protein
LAWVQEDILFIYKNHILRTSVPGSSLQLRISQRVEEWRVLQLCMSTFTVLVMHLVEVVHHLDKQLWPIHLGLTQRGRHMWHSTVHQYTHLALIKRVQMDAQ